jgi:hypothetical protein
MKKEAVDLLMRSIGDLYNAAADSQIKVRALEGMLEQDSPHQAETYKKALTDLRQSGVFSIDLAFFARLREELLQD